MQWVRKSLNFIGLKDWPIARKIVVGVIGTTIVLIGILMLIAPGPGTIVIPLGLLILASEFAWARWLLKRAKRIARQAKHKSEEVVHSVRE